MFTRFLGYSVIILALVFSSALAQDEELLKQQRDLSQIRQELEIKRKQLQKLSSKEKSVLEQLQGLEEELELLSRLMKKLDVRLKTVKNQIKNNDAELKNLEKGLSEKRTLLSYRLRDFYKFGRFYEYDFLLSADSPTDLLVRYKYFQLITQKDRELISSIVSGQQKSQQKKNHLQQNQRELLALKKEKTKEETNQQKRKVSRENILKNIRLEKKLQYTAIQQLEQSAKEIQKILETLEAQRKREKEIQRDVKSGLFEILKGRLSWPVSGKIIAAFGQKVNTEFQTVTFNPGIDIQAPQGEEIKAVADGKVIYSGWLRGYGKFLILEHADGYYTLYSHVSEILVTNGQEITEGQIIAQIGDTGSLEGPKLHFEIRKGKEQVDPLEWLKQ